MQDLLLQYDPDDMEPNNQGTVPEIFTSSICMSNKLASMQVVGPGTVPLLISHRLASPCIALHRLALHVVCKGNRVPNIPDYLLIITTLTYYY